jgi:thymidylate synthase (FAD)
MNGTLRSWIHYIQLREEHGTQMEHQIIAKEIKKIFVKQFPVIAQAVFNIEPEQQCSQLYARKHLEKQPIF